MELRALNSQDLWQMVRILKKFDIKHAASEIDPKLFKLSKFSPPMMVGDDGEMVPLPEADWTAAQKKKRDIAKEAGDELLWQVVGVVINNIDKCEDDVNRLLAMGTGESVEAITSLPADDYLALIVQYVTREGFGDFFTRAASLLMKKKISASSFASAAMSAT